MASEKEKDKKQQEEDMMEKETETCEEETKPCEEQEDKQEQVETVSMGDYIKLKYQFSEFVNRHKAYEHEFENYKKRTKEENKQAKDEGMLKGIKAIFPAIDSFKKARKIITDKSSLSGISLIEKSIFAELEKLGVKKIHCEGKKFDTDYHNAIALVEKEDVEPGMIVEEVEAGFTLNDKVIKYSQVIVSK